LGPKGRLTTIIVGAFLLIVWLIPADERLVALETILAWLH